ncbi:MAG: PKD domain-containing protein [Salibacteraceae bacterium]
MIIRLSILLFAVLSFQLASAQCTVYDGQGNAVNDPVWVSCSGGAYTLYVQSPNNLGYLIIDWGDGSPNTVVNGLVPPAFVSHTYAAAISNYNLTITDTTNNCVINGLVVMEEPVNASIQIPVGGVTQTCAPDDLIFTNTSTDVSNNTEFTWDFGDGSPILTFGPGNAGQTITHTYEQGTVNCVTQVTLTAENYCSFGNPTVATFNPIQIYDIDDAQITADNMLLCYPDTIVHFDNTTAKNCVPQGNTAQRYEYWNFGNYWGTGQDSIIDWSPFDPPAKPGYDIAFPGLGTYTIMMADSNMCGADTAFITVQIVPQPTAGLVMSVDSVCTGDEVVFTNTSAGGNQTLIDFGAGNGFEPIGAAATRTYGASGNYTIRLVQNIVGGTDNCTDTVELDLTVLVSPISNVNLAPAGGCDSITVSFVNSSSGAVSYFWNFGNGDTSTLQNPPPVSYNNPGETPVWLEVTSNNGCLARDTAIVSVYDVPTVNFGFQNICEDAIASFFDSSSVGFGGVVNNWSWSFGDSLNSTSTLQNPTFIYQDSGTYTVQLVASNDYCSDSLFQIITVEAKPSLTFTMSDSIDCSPLTVNFANSTTGASNYLWSFGDGNNSTNASPTHTFIHNALSDTTYYLTLVASSAFGCSDTLHDSVVVLGNPEAAFSSNAVLDCAPLEVDFTDMSNGATAWDWDFGDNTGSVVPNPSKIFDNQTQFITNYDVRLVVTAPNGCTDTALENITVYPEPLFNFSIVPDSGCSPLTVNFPVAVGAVIYDWDFGDGNTSTAPSPSHTFVNNTTNNQIFEVTLEATSPFGCVDTVTGSVKVFPLPQTNFTPSVVEGCEPLDIAFTNTSVGGTVYDWDFGNGQNLQTNNVTVNSTYTNSTNDTLSYFPKLSATTPNGCVDSVSHEIRVYRKIEASFGVPSPGCHPYNAPFTDSSLNAVNWDWDFDNGQFSTQQNPQRLFLNTTNGSLDFDVLLEVSSLEGCEDDTTVTLTVNPKPLANFNINNTPACHNEVVQLTNLSVQGVTNNWRFGNNAAYFENNQNVIDTTFQNFSTSPIQFEITLIAENSFGCKDTAGKGMQVFPVVDASFAAIDEGCSPLPVSFTNQSSGGNLFEWNFGDGATSFLNDPEHTYENNDSVDITYVAVLTVTSPYGCTDQDSMEILVHPTPKPQFTVNPTVQVFPDAEVTFSNLTSPGPWGYQWSFGDGGDTNVFHPDPRTYKTWGEFRILLKASSEYCEDTLSRLITIEPPLPVAMFDTLVDGCAPVSVLFNNQSEYGVNFEWDFGNGETSNSENPFYTYQLPGVYSVTLTVTGPGGETDSKTIIEAITVHEQPIANFTFRPTQVNVPMEPVTFVNYSQFADGYRWDFGDTTTSEEENPQHYYLEEGTFFPRLEVYNGAGCKDTMLSQVPVNAILVGDIKIPNAFTPNENGPLDGKYDPFAFDNQIFFPIVSGVSADNYTLSIFNRWGELIFETNDVLRGWDGYYKGKMCQQDAYVWKIVGEYVNGKKFSKVGDVTLIK